MVRDAAAETGKNSVWIAVESGRLFIRENDEEKQESLAESPNDSYLATSTDEGSFKPQTHWGCWAIRATDLLLSQWKRGILPVGNPNGGWP